VRAGICYQSIRFYVRTNCFPTRSGVAVRVEHGDQWSGINCFPVSDSSALTQSHFSPPVTVPWNRCSFRLLDSCWNATERERERERARERERELGFIRAVRVLDLCGFVCASKSPALGLLRRYGAFQVCGLGTLSSDHGPVHLYLLYSSGRIRFLKNT